MRVVLFRVVVLRVAVLRVVALRVDFLRPAIVFLPLLLRGAIVLPTSFARRVPSAGTVEARPEAVPECHTTI